MKITMDNLIGLLASARSDILALRSEVKYLEPKAHAYDTIAMVARMNERQGCHGEAYASVDTAWQIEEVLKEYTEQTEKKVS